MRERVGQTGQADSTSRKVPQTNGKSAKSVGKTPKATDTTLRTPDVASPSEAAKVVATFVSRPSHDERRRMIAEAAYYRAEQRGFSVGSDVDDWLAAEAEIDTKFPK